MSTLNSADAEPARYVIALAGMSSRSLTASSAPSTPSSACGTWLRTGRMKRGALASALQGTSLPGICEKLTGASEAAVLSDENVDSSTDSHENGDPPSAARGQALEGRSSPRQA